MLVKQQTSFVECPPSAGVRDCTELASLNPLSGWPFLHLMVRKLPVSTAPLVTDASGIQIQKSKLPLFFELWHCSALDKKSPLGLNSSKYYTENWSYWKRLTLHWGTSTIIFLKGKRNSPAPVLLIGLYRLSFLFFHCTRLKCLWRAIKRDNIPGTGNPLQVTLVAYKW